MKKTSNQIIFSFHKLLREGTSLQSKESPLHWWWRIQWGVPWFLPLLTIYQQMMRTCPWWFCQRLEFQRRSSHSLIQSSFHNLYKITLLKTHDLTDETYFSNSMETLFSLCIFHTQRWSFVETCCQLVLKKCN